MSNNYYPRFKNILGLCIAGLTLCGTLVSNKAVAQPTISSVSPGLGIGGVTSVAITGTNFNATAANDIVFFGATKATVTAATTTSLSVTVPVGAIYAPVSVLDNTTYFTGYQRYQFLPRFDTACFVNNNSVNFNPAVNISAGSIVEPPTGITICDVDGDGKPDVIVAYRGTTTATAMIGVFRNISTTGSISLSSFASPILLSSEVRVANVKAVDLDGDGKPEIISVGVSAARVDVFRNLSTSGTISFAAKQMYTTAVAPGEVAVGDFDRDGRPDLAVVCATGVISVFRNLTTAPGAFTASSFGTKVDFTVGSVPASMCVADVDGDGKLDLISSNDFSNSISVLRNTITASGTFSSSSFAAKVDFTTGSHPYEVQAGDLDGDGKPEIIVADSQSNNISIFYNTATSGTISSSSLATKVDFATSALVPEAFGLGDLNGDGRLDIAVSNLYSGSVSVFLNTTTGTGAISSSSFASPILLTVGTAPVGTVIGDLDGNNVPEIVVANNGSATFSILKNYPLPLNDTIGGDTAVCAGSTVPYTDLVSGGIWSITLHTGSTISTSGVVTVGSTLGYDTVSYTTTCNGDSNIAIKSVHVISSPTVAPIAGPGSVCVGDTIQLTDATTGGTWNNTLTAAIATVSATGVVTGVSAGSATITYGKSTACGVISSYFPVTVNAHPAAITGASSLCVGNNITLTDTPPGGSWAATGAGSITTVSGNGVLHGNATGTALVTYTLSGSGCRSFDTITVTTLPAPITGSDTICVGVTTALSDAATPGAWHTSLPGVATVDSNTGVVTGVAPGNTVITYGVTGSGCYAYDTVYVNPVGPPLVSISTTPSTGLCAGTVVTFSANTVGGGTTPTFRWKVNGANYGTGSSITYMPSNGDIVACILYSSSPCVSPDSAGTSIVVSLTPAILPSVSISTALGTDTVCAGNSAALHATPTNGGTSPQYEWYVNHVPVGFGSTFGYTPANGDMVTVAMESNAPCPSVDTVRDTLVLHVVPYATPTVSLSGSSIICEGYPAIFYADATFPGHSPIYQWTVNGIDTSTSDPLSYMPTAGDVVQVTMTSNYPCLTYPVAVSGTATITIIPVLLPSVDVYTSNYIVTPDSIMIDTFKAIVVNGGSAPAFQWYNNSIAIPGATNALYTTTDITAHDSFSVQVTNTDLCNNITVYDYVLVTTGYNVGVQHVSNGGGFVTIIPNPNNGSFILKGDLGMKISEDITVEITNMLGQVAYNKIIKAGSGVIDERFILGNELSAGTYLLSLHSEHMNKVIRFTLDK